MPVPPGNSLLNLGELSKPATVLIEKVSDAIGGIAKPWQTVRVAKAESQALVIAAKARIAVSEIEERALQRMIKEEAIKQQNIESITARAIPHLNADADASIIEDDWISTFFDRCRLVSDGQMRQIWASMLENECNSPGSYSKRTIDLVSTFDKLDATLFETLCSTICYWNEPIVLLYDINISESDANLAIGFTEFQHLEKIGLIHIQQLGGYTMRGMLGNVPLSYAGELVWLQINTLMDIPIGQVMLSQAGKQLRKICSAQRNSRYFGSILRRLVDAHCLPWQSVRPACA